MQHIYIINQTELLFEAIQRLYEWRGGFSRVAMNVLATFWTSDPPMDTPAKCAEYVKFELGPGLPFIWAIVNKENPMVLTWVSIVCVRCIDMLFVDSFRSMAIQADPYYPRKPLQRYSSCPP
jgi:hypothetical protein